MKIHAQMDLGQLAEHMGSAATKADATAMRRLLLTGDYADTADVSDAEWREMCEWSLPLATATLASASDIVVIGAGMPGVALIDEPTVTRVVE